MAKKIVWVMLSCLMVVTLVLASCKPAAVEKEEKIITGKVVEREEKKEIKKEVTPEKEMVRDSLGRLVEKPKYGGTYVGMVAGGPQLWDERLGHRSRGWTLIQTNEELLVGNWAKGPTGSGEASFLYDEIPAPAVIMGQLAESWEIPDNQTLIFHIRKGVHWHNKPPVNGRELTADDVVSTFVNLWNSPRSYLGATFPASRYLAGEASKAVTAPDKWTVVFKSSPGMLGEVYVMAANYTFIVPPELKKEHGDNIDWMHTCGTGPFILIDYVSESSLLFERNPNYWGKHPLYPQDTMPYLDGVKLLVIPDYSTRITALRTGKIDLLGLAREDAESVIRTNPELKYLKYNPGSGLAVHFRVDQPESPIHDDRVRRALCMAVNKQEIVDEYFGGEAELLNWPIAPLTEFMDMYTPLEKQPEIVREQFEYHPDKARQLLAEAGYPNGFKTSIYTTAVGVDTLSVIKAAWADIGVDLDIQVLEAGTYAGIMYGKRYKDMILGVLLGYSPFRVTHVLPGNFYNYAMLDDPHINETYEKIIENYFNEPVKRQLTKELALYELENRCIMLQIPVAKAYTFWQPWLKGYSGEIQTGKWKIGDYTRYVWLDQKLKAKMTGKK